MTPTDDLISRLRSINTDDLVGDEAQRIRVRDALFETLRKVQSPWDVAWEMNWVNAANVACIKTMIDMAVFSKWVSDFLPTYSTLFYVERQLSGSMRMASGLGKEGKR